MSDTALDAGDTIVKKTDQKKYLCLSGVYILVGKPDNKKDK